ncbi:fish-egg lectin-like [Hemiscyllium ocellatum]|uniref:fish-egg lectin-like n=1 Tax=Hemiscyllium ocellatum TaxID=170820 RepID=UPI00296778B4|nr:fish-egg lectin-like [Hemiscyllium ocellatum]
MAITRGQNFKEIGGSCLQVTLSDLTCNRIDGNLKQIDAGNGQVYGVSANGSVYTRHDGTWVWVPGNLAHVTVGPAGVWGVDGAHSVYRKRGGFWSVMSGLLKQIDAGGNGIVSGVNMNDEIFCVHQDEVRSAISISSPNYNRIDGQLKYYSCGPYSCWGVNANDVIYVRPNVESSQCAGSNWVKVDGGLSMIETGTDGSVYGVNSNGNVYRRDGITSQNPAGTSWTQINIGGISFKHVTVDLEELWLVTTLNNIIHCQ